MVTALECIGGHLAAYAPGDGWVSAVAVPDGVTASVWMCPGWMDKRQDENAAQLAQLLLRLQLAKLG
jgi:hypothetical protein